MATNNNQEFETQDEIVSFTTNKGNKFVFSEPSISDLMIIDDLKEGQSGSVRGLVAFMEKNKIEGPVIGDIKASEFKDVI